MNLQNKLRQRHEELTISESMANELLDKLDDQYIEVKNSPDEKFEIQKFGYLFTEMYQRDTALIIIEITREKYEKYKEKIKKERLEIEELLQIYIYIRKGEDGNE